jgi:4-amino-4-deoxy-L-arabinose transferase-like glycosyltransferase
MRTRVFGSWRFLVFLAAVQAAVLFPFRFTDGFGDRDSYRVLLGLTDTLRSGALFNSPLLYNREPSFGYYSLFYALAPLTGKAPLVLSYTMNWIAFLSVILFVIPEYMIADRLFGKRVAVTSGLMLIATPVWWHTGLYAHPITTSLLLFFSGLAILSRYRDLPPVWTRVIALACFAAALTFRFDVVLLLPAVFAVLWEVRQTPFRNVAKESIFYIAGSAALFGVAHQLLPVVDRGIAPTPITTLLVRYHNFSAISSGVRMSIISLGRGFTPILLITAPIAMILLLRKRRYPALLFVSGVIAINLIFWLPNSSQPRHYLMMAPALSISAALVLEEIFSRMPRFRSSSGVTAGVAAAVGILGVSLALGHAKGPLTYFSSLFEKQIAFRADIARAKRAAEGLVRVPALGAPVIVLCDSNLVITEMEKLAADTTAVLKSAHAGSQSFGFHDVRQGKNEFIMVEQGWDEDEVAGFEKSGVYAGLPVASASFLTLPYKGSRRILALESRPAGGQPGL